MGGTESKRGQGGKRKGRWKEEGLGEGVVGMDGLGRREGFERQNGESRSRLRPAGGRLRWEEGVVRRAMGDSGHQRGREGRDGASNGESLSDKDVEEVEG
jgi:hypothetical protein